MQAHRQRRVIESLRCRDRYWSRWRRQDSKGPVTQETTKSVINLIVLKQMSLLCEISYLFNSKVLRQNI